jgi:integrase
MASIKTRVRKDGTKTWAVLYRIKDNQGRTRESSKTFETRSGAETLCELIDRVGVLEALRLADIDGAPRPIKGPTVTEWVADYIEHLTGVNKNTRQDYRKYLANDIAPALGAVLISELTREQVAAWVNAMEGSKKIESNRRRLVLPTSAKTIANKHGLLSAALNRAVKDGKIPTNVAKGIKAARTESREQIALTAQEFAVVLAAMPAHYRPLVEFLAETGCRFSEATALRPSDINRDKATVRIARTWRKARYSADYAIGAVKTPRSRRTITVRKALLDKLDYGHEYLFTNTSGDPLKITSFRTVWNYHLAKAVKDGKLAKHRKPRIHDLRHSHASWLIHANVSPLAIQNRLGHADIRTTYNVYGHLMDAAEESVLAALDATLPG